MTSRLDQLVAAVVLGKSSPLPIKENVVVYQYAWSKESEGEIAKELFHMVCIAAASGSVANKDILGYGSPRCGGGNCGTS